MTDLRQAAEDALDEMDGAGLPGAMGRGEVARYRRALESLRSALAAPQAEPVAWRDIEGVPDMLDAYIEAIKSSGEYDRWHYIPEVDNARDAVRYALTQAKPAQAWAEGYKQGVEDERTSAANIGIAGFDAKVEPARQNPYGSAAPQAEPVDHPAPAADVVRDAAMLDFMEAHPDLHLRHHKGKWALVGIPCHEFDMHTTLRAAIDAAMKGADQ